MLYHIRDKRCVTILLPPGVSLGKGAAGLLIRYARRRCGAAPWGNVFVEQFSSGSGTLLLARPAVQAELVIPDDFFQFVHNYFKD